MKKVVLTIAIVFAFGIGAKAQIGLTDAFFNDWQTSNSIELIMPGLPGGHGIDDDISLPLGSGVFILGALSAGYATLRRRKK